MVKRRLDWVFDARRIWGEILRRHDRHTEPRNGSDSINRDIVVIDWIEERIEEVVTFIPSRIDLFGHRSGWIGCYILRQALLTLFFIGLPLLLDNSRASLFYSSMHLRGQPLLSLNYLMGSRN